MFGWILVAPICNISSHGISVAVEDGCRNTTNLGVVKELPKKPATNFNFEFFEF